MTADLGPGLEVELTSDQVHHLLEVRPKGRGRGPGQKNSVHLFNGRDGEWLAETTEAAEAAEAKRRTGQLPVVRPHLMRPDVMRLRVLERLRPQSESPDLWLLFAPIEKLRSDFIAEKACELGCRRILPVLTRHAASGADVKTERLHAHAVETAEQCGLLSVPEIAEPAPLDQVLADWPGDRQILFCDETGPRPPAMEVLKRADPGPWAVLIGPTCGFSADEALRLRKMRLVHPVSLGPRVMRADTAAVSALTLWQSMLGDWR